MLLLALAAAAVWWLREGPPPSPAAAGTRAPATALEPISGEAATDASGLATVSTSSAPLHEPRAVAARARGPYADAPLGVPTLGRAGILPDRSSNCGSTFVARSSRHR